MSEIILASKSPRRLEIMNRYIADIKTIQPDVFEHVLTTDRPEVAVMRLAFEKADAAVKEYTGDGIIIAADTLVYLDKIMGKPNSRQEGREMLGALSGKIHCVYTGICIIGSMSGRKICDYEMTEVEFYTLSDVDIERYLDTNEYADKAGAYGIQGYGELFIKGIRGCYNNVKGLPVAKLNNLLKKHFDMELM